MRQPHAVPSRFVLATLGLGLLGGLGVACNRSGSTAVVPAPDVPAAPAPAAATPAARPAEAPAAATPASAPASAARVPDLAPEPVAPPPELASQVTLERIARAERPVLLLSPPGDPRRFVVEQRGKIRVLLPDSTFAATPFLDIGEMLPRISQQSEQGLLGLAFHPRFAENGRFYVNYTKQSGDTVIAEYRVPRGADRADPKSARVIAELEQPYENHNGGHVVFGPDGKLWIGMGDGGSGGDPKNRGQNRADPLGKMLRVDVDTAKAKPEIVLLGLRNPWRFEFDPATKDLWIADVGQNAWEEIDFLPWALVQPGVNLGWRLREGTRCFKAETCGDGAGLVPPVAEYDHKTGCSVTGGYVYRGATFPALAGHYFYADFCTALIRSVRVHGDEVVAHLEWRPTLDPDSKLALLSSFGMDAAGELYLMSLEGPIYKLVPTPARRPAR